MPFRTEAKQRAKHIRTYLSKRDVDLTHGDCLEIVAKANGFESWNVASANINELKIELRQLQDQIRSSIKTPRRVLLRYREVIKLLGKDKPCLKAGYVSKRLGLSHAK